MKRSSRYTFAICTALLLSLGQPSDAKAQSAANFYDVYDAADVALEIRITATPPDAPLACGGLAACPTTSQAAGTVSAAVLSVVKGAHSAGAIEFYNDPSSVDPATFSRGASMIVVLAARGQVNTKFWAIADLPDDTAVAARVVSSVKAFGSTTDPGTRAAALIAGIASGAPWAFSAGMKLLDSPDLLNAVDASGRDRLFTAAAVNGDPPILELLARFYDRRVDKLIPTNDPYGVADLARIWRRDRSFETETSRSKLAQVLTSAAPTQHKLSALERCERVAGTSFYSWQSYLFGDRKIDWSLVAGACRGT